MQRLVSFILLTSLSYQAMAQKEIRTSINISATPSKVWEVLTDFHEYENWNPFLKSVEGDMIIGKKIKINAGGMKFKPKLLVFDLNKEIRWKGKFIIKGLFDGIHKFELIDNKDGTTTFNQEEKFTGLLVGLFKKKLERETQPGFEAMNEKLKEIAEKLMTQDNQ